MLETHMPSPSLKNRINKLSQQFGLIETFVEEVSEEVEVIDTSSDDVLECLKEDFKCTRNSLRETITQAKKVLEHVTKEIIQSGESPCPELVSSYSSLLGSVNTSSKLLFDMYKSMLDTKLKLEGKPTEEKSPSSVTNILVANINDILEQRRQFLS